MRYAVCGMRYARCSRFVARATQQASSDVEVAEYAERAPAHEGRSACLEYNNASNVEGYS